MPVTDNPTANLFWGIVLKSDKRYEQTVEETFHISKACLEPTQNNGKICSVYLEQDNEEFILCNLSQKNLNETLDLNFTETEKICFRVEGGGTVHLTGYLVPDEEGPMYPMEMSDEEDDEEEEVPPKLVKKRKLENGESVKADKPLDKLLEETKKAKKDEIKQAEAMKKILEKKADSKESDESEEDSEEDDSEEDDEDNSEVTAGSSFFDSTANEEDDDDSEDDGEEEEDSEDEDEGEDSEESSEDDSKKETPAKNKNKGTPNSNGIKQTNETPKSLKKEKVTTPQPSKTEKKTETPVQKKENKPEAKSDTPANKKDKKNKQLQNGNAQSAPNTPSAQTPKNKETPKKEAKTPSKDQQAVQTPNKTPKRTLKGGLVVEDLKIGNGPEAKSGKLVGMYYDGKLKSNNKQFDAQKQGKPFRFRLGRGEVIKGWDVGVEGMKVGGKRKLIVPANLGYGSQGAPPDIPPNATLVFEVECKMVN